MKDAGHTKFVGTKFIGITAIFIFLAAFVIPAQAHRQNESYIYLNVEDAGLAGRFEIKLRDLGQLIPLDENEDGIVSQEEFNTNQDKVYDFFQPILFFVVQKQKFPIAIVDHEFINLGFGTFVKIQFTTAINTKMPDSITVEHKSYFDKLESGHRVLLLIESNTKIGLTGNESKHSLVFSNGDDPQILSLVGAPWQEVFWTFINHGFIHILIGYDHVAFLFTLLLSSVLLTHKGGFEPVPRFQDALFNVIKIATLFTIAHSVTLSLAALGWISFPERIIESLIAVSIVIVAFNNLFALREHWKWIAVFGLGLVHGLGFANVLAPLGVESNTIIVSLLAFNVGVEIGQAAIIAVCFPVLFSLRNTPIYVPLVLRGGSVLLLAIALLWFFERAFQFNLPIVPFLKSLIS